jgi:hypothetical protein
VTAWRLISPSPSVAKILASGAQCLSQSMRVPKWLSTNRAYRPQIASHTNHP